jgi:hypothetical protein
MNKELHDVLAYLVMGIVWAAFIEKLDQLSPNRKLHYGDFDSRFKLIIAWPIYLTLFILTLIFNRNGNDKNGGGPRPI